MKTQMQNQIEDLQRKLNGVEHMKESKGDQQANKDAALTKANIKLKKAEVI